MMKASRLDTIFNTLSDHDWHIVRRRAKPAQFESDIHRLYAKLPEDYMQFLGQISLCTNTDETAWFLTEEDFLGKSEAAFSWNEFEAMSLDAAEGDEDLETSIKKFWREHMPIMFSLRSGYAFLAINLSVEGYGEIVIGREPEFEDVSKICSSFEQLMNLLEVTVRDKSNSTLNGFI